MSSLSWITISMVAVLHLCFFMEVESYLPHKITQLPGQPPISFQHFSGYITVDDKEQRALFYYFAEAEIDPVLKPVVLWLNGGPGCSSVGVGAFSENGPFRPSGEMLVRNEYSWNKARDNLVFLQRWFDKFPQYKGRDLFITGESYAGHYVPQLAQLVIQFIEKEKLFNLKGIAIFHGFDWLSYGLFRWQLGNPVLEFSTDFNSRAEYFWSHGLISDSTYHLFTSACNYSRYVSEYYRGSVSPVCSRVMNQVTRETSKFVDKYDVTLDVCISSVLSQSLLLRPQQVTERIDVCVEDETVNYLNRKDVQNALHARLIGDNKWTVCSSGDQDSVIPLTGSRKLVHSLAVTLGLNTTVPYRVWFEGKQVGGWTQVYGNILSFATIRGASHEAPFSQPERSLVLFKAFLERMPLPEAF
ncbi:Peptidase S10 [Cinnamomum micranthum f. kanehirae]|uniref:Carboxypeptidase n=1 Tax=Cinnamomum micranthum f. kanehirae TaxID=337451 RepID=A0A3S3NI25_9MAGN|nr:Peptidase S10 [Cinnamomum micranthum f. kanehirae]